MSGRQDRRAGAGGAGAGRAGPGRAEHRRAGEQSPSSRRRLLPPDIIYGATPPAKWDKQKTFSLVITNSGMKYIYLFGINILADKTLSTG